MTRNLICRNVVGLGLAVGMVFACAASDQSVKDSQRMVVLARDMLAPIELQSLPFCSESQPDPMDQALRIRHACLFLEAAVRLDPKNTEAWRELYPLYLQAGIADPGRVLNAVNQYIQLAPNNPFPVQSWMTFELNRLQDRESRETFLQQNLATIQGFPLLYSQTMTQLGVFAFEKGLIEGERGARSLFENAIQISYFNDDAVARLLRLPFPEIPAADNITADQLQQQQNALEKGYHFYQVLLARVHLLKNPYDVAALVDLIELLEQLGYHEPATNYYTAAYDLIEAFPQFAGLDYKLRLLYCMAEYAAQNYYVCLDRVFESLRQYPDDLLLQVICAKTFQKTGPSDQANQAFQRAGQIASSKLVGQVDQLRLNELTELAWFFCFIQPDPGRALELCRAASQKSPNDSRIRYLLAYANILNGMPVSTSELPENSDPDDPVYALVQAHLHLAQKQDDAARRILTRITPFRRGILDNQFDNLLGRLQESSPTPVSEQSMPPESPGQPDLIITMLRDHFNNHELDLPLHPEKYIHCSLSLKTDIFYYNDPIMCMIHITNLGDFPLILGPDSVVNPVIAIQATVTPTTGSTVLPAATNSPESVTFMLAHRYLLERNLLQPGRSILHEEPLNIGQLRQLLQKNPRMAYQISFQLILDPVPDGHKSLIGKLPAIQPSPVTVVRTAVVPARNKLNYYLESLQSGPIPARIQAMKVLCSLMHESQDSFTEFSMGWENFVRPETIWPLIGENLNHPNPSVRAWAAYTAKDVVHPDPSFPSGPMQKSLGDTDWFVRFMAMDALSSITEMEDYLRWKLETEGDLLLLRQYQWLLHEFWTVIEKPLMTGPKEQKEQKN